MASQHRAFGRERDTGIHTVEGTRAGARAAGLTRQRVAEQEDYEAKRRKLEEDASRGVGRIDDKFSLSSDALFQQRTGGLLTAEQFRKAREEDELRQKRKDARGLASREETANTATNKKKTKNSKAKKQAANKSLLSFGAEEEEEASEETEETRSDKVVLKKCPHVETGFLPDAERERAERERRAELEVEWDKLQARVKKEPVEITFSYWDGTGHRRSLKVPKGSTVGAFVKEAQSKLSSKFPELRGTSSDNILYVKEDLIIPHHYAFYDLIVAKARGKSGPLFCFDVHDDVRLRNDSRVEKDESHPGKLVLRSWYERNKHIFPASRWEVYDPAVDRSGRYTVADPLTS